MRCDVEVFDISAERRYMKQLRKDIYKGARLHQVELYSHVARHDDDLRGKVSIAAPPKPDIFVGVVANTIAGRFVEVEGYSRMIDENGILILRDGNEDVWYLVASGGYERPGARGGPQRLGRVSSSANA